MSRRKGALLLTPGAGADRNQATLVAIDEALSTKTFSVERVDFPYRKAGRKAPDKAPVLLETVRTEAAALQAATNVKDDRLFLGGRSMGGRMCSMAAADDLLCGGLVLISYPLHPPGKPEKLRVDHFPDITVPVLFVSGTRDAFGTPKELEKHAKKISGDVTHVWLEGGDHGLKRFDSEVVDAVGAWIATRP